MFSHLFVQELLIFRKILRDDTLIFELSRNRLLRFDWQFPVFICLNGHVRVFSGIIRFYRWDLEKQEGWCMAARERLTEPCVTIEWLLAKQRSSWNFPVFPDLNGIENWKSPAYLIIDSFDEPKWHRYRKQNITDCYRASNLKIW